MCVCHKGHKAAEGTGASLLGAEAEEAGTVEPGEGSTGSHPCV